MITNLIVFLSLFFGAAYTVIWLAGKDYRKQIERPKFNFQNQVEHFENQCQLSERFSEEGLKSNE